VKRLAIVVLGVATLTVVGPAAGARALTVQTSVSPESIYVADVVTARVDVFFDPRLVDVRTIRVTSSFGLWQELQPIRSSYASSPTIGRRTWLFTLACLSLSCIPRAKMVESFALPPVTVTAQTLRGSSLKARKPWPVINVAGRFVPPNVHAPVRLRTQTMVPAATYRLNPEWLARTLDVIGALIIAVGLGVGAREITRWRGSRNRVVDTRPPIVRTLELVREARDLDVEVRRRAVGLLARVLPHDRQDLASAASEVAWSVNEPSADNVDEIVCRVEAQLEEPE